MGYKQKAVKKDKIINFNKITICDLLLKHIFFEKYCPKKYLQHWMDSTMKGISWIILDEIWKLGDGDDDVDDNNNNNNNINKLKLKILDLQC